MDKHRRKSLPDKYTREYINGVTFSPVLSSPDEQSDRCGGCPKGRQLKCSKVFVERSPMNQVEFHEMFEFVPKRNIIPFVANHLHHQKPVRKYLQLILPPTGKKYT